MAGGQKRIGTRIAICQSSCKSLLQISYKVSLYPSVVPQPNKDSSAGRFTEFLPRSSRVPPPEFQSSAHRLPEFRPPLVSPIGPVPPLLVSHQNKCSADTGWGETGH